MGLSPAGQRHTQCSCATLEQRCARYLTSPNTKLENPFCQRLPKLKCFPKTGRLSVLVGLRAAL